MTGFVHPPRVQLLNAFASPVDNVVAAARTCYAPRIILAQEVATDPAARDRLARGLLEAGHHTTLQHAHFQFAIENVSRLLVWSLLHAHPFHNSEQVSQRYVEVRPGTWAMPPLEGSEARAVFTLAAERQMATYHELVDLLEVPAAREYLRLFPARAGGERWARQPRKRAQEAARYVLPLATHAHLHHTISLLTLLRYRRLCRQPDAPTEARLLVDEMVAAALAHDPALAVLLDEPLPPEELPETPLIGRAMPAQTRAEFDAALGRRVSLLVGRKDNEPLLAQAVRDVLGLPRALLDDDAAIALATDPRANRLLADRHQLSSLAQVGRALVHPSYTFRKRLSIVADSQNQRHRLTPATRPILAAHLGDAPDFTRPSLVAVDERASRRFDECMAETWEAIARLRRLGVPAESVAYLLPGAATVRLTESADLLGLQHKLRARLCYNAQEEIWRASLDEARQLREVEPRIARHLLPPCALRLLAGATPVCPEKDRYCGVAVWKLDLDEYRRVI